MGTMGRKTMALILFHPAILSVVAVLGFGSGASVYGDRGRGIRPFPRHQRHRSSDQHVAAENSALAAIAPGSQRGDPRQS
jgi:hypothetical protein